MTWCIQKVADSKTESDITLSMKHNGAQPLPSHHSDLLNSIHRCVHLFTFAKLMCKKVASHCGLIYTNVHIYGTIFFSFFPFFWGGLSFFCINFYLDFVLDFLIAPPPKKNLRQNKQMNEQLTLKESLQLNARSGWEVSATQAKAQQREIKKDAGTSPPSWPESQRNPAGLQDTGSYWLDRQK